MVTPVYMTKYTTKKSSIYYFVEAPSEQQQFYISIDTLKKTLTFYLNNTLDNPLKEIDLSSSDNEFITIPGIQSLISNYVTAQVYKAMLKNDFPEKINYDFH